MEESSEGWLGNRRRALGVLVLFSAAIGCQQRRDEGDGRLRAERRDDGDGRLEAEYPNSPQWTEAAALSEDMITCDFRLQSMVQSENGDLVARTKREPEPIVVTFADLKTESPTTKTNAGSSALTKTLDDGTDIFLYQRAPAGNVVTYAINRKSRQAILAKTYFSNGDALGYVMLGRCY